MGRKGAAALTRSRPGTFTPGPRRLAAPSPPPPGPWQGRRSLMGLLRAAVLGLVQGITEFLPISSTAHLRITPELFGWQDPGAAFDAIIQLGTVAAVLVYFRHDIVQLLRAWVEGIHKRDLMGTTESRLA